MIRYYTKSDGRLMELQSAEGACWINIAPPFLGKELEVFSEEYHIPLDFLTDSLDKDERSRYEREDGIRLIMVNTPVLSLAEGDTEPIYTTIPVGLILTPDFLVTISSEENPVIQKFLEERVKYFNPNDDTLFVLQLMEQNVYRYLVCLKKLDLKRNLIEKELSDTSRNKELQQLLGIEKSLVYFVNSLSSNELLKMKIKRVDFLSIRNDEYKTDLFEDILIDNSQALEMANVYTNILHGTMDAYGSIISNNLNYTMQRLTTITIVLMVPTLLSSFYGMNVHLPFEKVRLAYFYIIVVSVVLSIILLRYFQKKKML